MINKNQNKKSKRGEELSRKAGFSLVEVLFTLMILSVGVSAVAILMTTNIRNSITAKNQIIASELAQEGVELVINIKNIKDKDPIKFTADMPANGTDYRVDYNSDYFDLKGSPASYPGNAGKQLKMSGSYFLHTAARASKFYRKISIAIVPDSDPAELKKNVVVTSYVSWNGAGIPAVCNVATKCVAVTATIPDLE